MNQSNIDKLEKYRFILGSRSFTPSPGYNLGEVLEVIHQEFDGGYKVDWGCNYCVMKMVEYAFAELDKRINKIKVI